jgi:hypothetical protein
MKDIKDLKKLFRKRKEYTIYFVPYFRSEMGILFEIQNNNAGMGIIHGTNEFAADLKESAEERQKITFPSDSKPV